MGKFLPDAGNFFSTSPPFDHAGSAHASARDLLRSGFVSTRLAWIVAVALLALAAPAATQVFFLHLRDIPAGSDQLLLISTVDSLAFTVPEPSAVLLLAAAFLVWLHRALWLRLAHSSRPDSSA